MPVRTERTVFTIEIFSVTLYLDGTQLDPDDGNWFPIIDHGSVVEFNSHDDAIKYIKEKFPNSRWRIIRETTTREVENASTLGGMYL
jgi:hypothetical protein